MPKLCVTGEGTGLQFTSPSSDLQFSSMSMLVLTRQDPSMGNEIRYLVYQSEVLGDSM